MSPPPAGFPAARWRSAVKESGRSRLRVEELELGCELEVLGFLERDSFGNLRIIWALRRWGLFDMGLAEQGRYLVARVGREVRGVLFHNNLGIWRLAAPAEVARELAERALGLWGSPALLAGPQEGVDALLAALPELRDRVEHREEEVTMALPRDAGLAEDGVALKAGEEDLDDLVRLEGMLHRELLGGVPEDWVLRSQMLRAVEEEAAAVVRVEGRAVAKAEMEAITPGADELGGVYVMPGFRRRGYALSACALVCAGSLRKGKEVRLETQRDNAAAIGLYRKLGFTAHGPHLAVRLS